MVAECIVIFKKCLVSLVLLCERELEHSRYKKKKLKEKEKENLKFFFFFFVSPLLAKKCLGNSYIITHSGAWNLSPFTFLFFKKKECVTK